MTNIFTPLAKSVLLLLGLTVATSATAIQKKGFGAAMTMLITYNEKI